MLEMSLCSLRNRIETFQGKGRTEVLAALWLLEVPWSFCRIYGRMNLSALALAAVSV